MGTGDRSGRTYLGAEMDEFEQLFPGMAFINRSSVGAWEAPGYADFVRSTGRKQLIMAGITTEQCVTFTAQSALAEGYQVYVVLDASASLDSRSEVAAIARLTALGAIVTTWSPLAAELLGDFARPEAAGLIKIYSEHQGSLRMVEDGFNVAVKATRSALGAADNASAKEPTSNQRLVTYPRAASTWAAAPTGREKRMNRKSTTGRQAVVATVIMAFQIGLIVSAALTLQEIGLTDEFVARWLQRFLSTFVVVLPAVFLLARRAPGSPPGSTASCRFAGPIPS